MAHTSFINISGSEIQCGKNEHVSYVMCDQNETENIIWKDIEIYIIKL